MAPLFVCISKKSETRQVNRLLFSKPLNSLNHSRICGFGFGELSNGRQYGAFGPAPITFLDIKAWGELMKVELTAWEVEVLKEIDRVYMAEAMKNDRPRFIGHKG